MTLDKTYHIKLKTGDEFFDLLPENYMNKDIWIYTWHENEIRINPDSIVFAECTDMYNERRVNDVVRQWERTYGSEIKPIVRDFIERNIDDEFEIGGNVLGGISTKSGKMIDKADYISRMEKNKMPEDNQSYESETPLVIDSTEYKLDRNRLLSQMKIDPKATHGDKEIDTTR